MGDILRKFHVPRGVVGRALEKYKGRRVKVNDNDDDDDGSAGVKHVALIT